MRRVYRRPKPKPQRDFYRINERIRVPEVRLINDENEQLGVMPTAKALALAKEEEMDLVEVSPKAQPPVAKITDYGRMKYQKEKQIHKQKAKQKKVDIKAIRLSLRISSHDFQFRLQQATKFLEKGHKLKVEIILKGREKRLREKAFEIMNNFIDELKKNEKFNIATEQDLTKQPNGFNIILVNKKA